MVKRSIFSLTKKLRMESFIDYVVQQLENNKLVFQGLLRGKDSKITHWRESPERWTLLEIICHLIDEEREDFRQRVQTTLESPGSLPPPIDPQGWIESRSYNDQDYDEKVEMFIAERSKSVQWLKSLNRPNWLNSYNHPQLGKMTSKAFLLNWLAHDYHHIRQINRLLYSYLQINGDLELSYAGDW